MLKTNKALVQLTQFKKGEIMKYFFILLAILLLTVGCTKKEFKTNWHNVKDGTSKRWNKSKENFSESTQEYKENKKKDDNKTEKAK